MCEQLFAECKIQVLVCTSTLAWGVNLPAHLVVIKGTEFYDGKTRRYVDFPITDALQMMGRAGRPQFDKSGVCVIMCHEPKKAFYKKFLYEPFPVESSLAEALPDHFNAEIVKGTIASKQDAVDWVTWTYFFRRLVKNPSYYDLESVEHEALNAFLSSLVENALAQLEDARCVATSEDDGVEPLSSAGWRRTTTSNTPAWRCSPRISDPRIPSRSCSGRCAAWRSTTSFPCDTTRTR